MEWISRATGIAEKEVKRSNATNCVKGQRRRRWGFAGHTMRGTEDGTYGSSIVNPRAIVTWVIQLLVGQTLPINSLHKSVSHGTRKPRIGRIGGTWATCLRMKGSSVAMAARRFTASAGPNGLWGSCLYASRPFVVIGQPWRVLTCPDLVRLDWFLFRGRGMQIN